MISRMTRSSRTPNSVGTVGVRRLGEGDETGVTGGNLRMSAAGDQRLFAIRTNLVGLRLLLRYGQRPYFDAMHQYRRRSAHDESHRLRDVIRRQLPARVTACREISCDR